MQDENFISNIDNQYQLIAYLAQQNQLQDSELIQEAQESSDEVEENDQIDANTRAIEEIGREVLKLREELAEIEGSQDNLQDTVDNIQDTLQQQTPSEENQENQTDSDRVECLLDKCDEDFTEDFYRNMHLNKHEASEVAEAIEQEDNTDEILNQATSVASESFKSELEQKLGIGTDSNSTESDGRDSEDEEDSFPCPKCGNKYGTAQGLSNHITQQDDHTNPSDYFEEDGEYDCPYCDGSKDDSNEFTLHLRNEHDTTKVRAYVDVEDSPENLDKDDMYDEDGNFKPLKKRRKHIEDYSSQKIEQMFYNYLNDQKMAKTQKAITDAVFSREYDSGTKEYTKAYDALGSSERIQSTNKMGRQNRYYTDEAMIRQSKREDAMESVKDEIGQHNWKLFVRAAQSLLPEQGETAEITYYDFSGEYMGDEEYPTEDMWELFAFPGNTVLRDALRQVVAGELEFKCKNTAGSESKSSVKQWTLEIQHN